LNNMPGLTVFESEANFILVQLAQAHEVWLRLYEDDGILLRDFSEAPYLGDCLRLGIGTPQENDDFLAAFERYLGGRA